MNHWSEWAAELYALNSELRISGFTEQEALQLTTEVAKTMAAEGLKKG